VKEGFSRETEKLRIGERGRQAIIMRWEFEISEEKCWL